MAYDTELAARIRTRMSDVDGLTEKKMFGGIAFLVHSNMCIGVLKSDITARVGKERYGDLSEEPGARPMDFTGRPMKGWLFIGKDHLTQNSSLQTWIDRCLHFARSLPAK